MRRFGQMTARKRLCLVAGAVVYSSFVLVLTASFVFALEAVDSPRNQDKKSLPAKHPALEEKSSRDRLNTLTNQVATHLKGGPSPKVVRKNFIDDYIFGKMEQQGIPHAPLSTDEEFFRRIHLDLWGRIPDSQEVRKFLKDNDPNKRDKLIDHMLGLDHPWEDFSKRKDYDPQNPAVLQAERDLNETGPWQVDKAFVARWSYWFSDLFRNTSAFLADGRNAFYHYIYDSLRINVPYDKFVTDMLTATTIAARDSGPVNLLLRDYVGDDKVDGYVMHEDTLDEIAISTAKYFLGVNMECVSCHDGAGHLEPINLWLSRRKRPELWRQAAFFGNIRIFRPTLGDDNFALLEGPPLEKYVQFRMGGGGYNPQAPSAVRPARYKVNVSPQFILNGEKPETGRNPRQEFARILTSQPQFAKATVNMIWAELMGVGIVDPPFGWDLARQDPKNPPPSPWTVQPTHPELLEALAQDFREHNFDLRYLMALITKSSAYQLSSRFPGEWKEGYSRYYARRPVRRLPAEMIFDGICKATNVFENLAIKGTSETVHYVLETYSNEDIADHSLKDFLHYFGQSERKVDAPITDGSIIQATLLVNSDIVKKRVLASTEGSRVSALLKKTPALSNDEIVDELFLSTLSRFPTDKERAICVGQLERRRDRGVEEIQWALLNKREFLFNY